MKPDHLKCLALLLLIPAASLADDAELLRCRGIADSAARLACYDALAAKAGAAKAVPSPARPASPPAPPAPPRDLPPQTSQQFGLEHQATVAPLGSIESHIPGRFEGWRPNSRITLANGQVWQIADGSSNNAFDLVNPKVTVRRGALGAFYLDIENDNRAPRVRRVQ